MTTETIHFKESQSLGQLCISGFPVVDNPQLNIEHTQEEKCSPFTEKHQKRTQQLLALWQEITNTYSNARARVYTTPDSSTNCVAAALSHHDWNDTAQPLDLRLFLFNTARLGEDLPWGLPPLEAFQVTASLAHLVDREEIPVKGKVNIVKLCKTAATGMNYITGAAPKIHLRQENIMMNPIVKNANYDEIMASLVTVVNNSTNFSARTMDITLRNTGEKTVIVLTDDAGGVQDLDMLGQEEYADRPTLFQKGRSGRKSTGLGLYGVWELVKGMNGVVTARNTTHSNGKPGLELQIMLDTA